MTSFSFEIAFNAITDGLQDMLQKQPGRAGVIDAEIRGHRRVRIAEVKHGHRVQPDFKATGGGLLITRGDYCELVPYWDIFTLRASTYAVRRDK